MSVYERRESWCPACGHAHTVKAVDSANPVRHPPFLDELLARTFARHTCPRCGHGYERDDPVLWTDVPAGLVAWMLPAAARLNWSAAELEVADGLAGPTRQEGPAFVRAWGERARLRLVFGLEELREKVVAARAGVDDRVVEALKLAHADGDTASAPVLERVDDVAGLVLASPEAPHDPVAVVPWAAYHRRAAALAGDPACAGLVDGTWVHWLRAAFPRHATA